MTQERKMDAQLKSKLLFFLKKDIAPTRGMLYNNLQAWKRTIYELVNRENSSTLGVNGEVWKAMALTDGDKKFIDEQMLWFLDTGNLPEEVIWRYAELTYQDLSKGGSLTSAQINLKRELKEALGLVDNSFVESQAEKQEDLPF